MAKENLSQAQLQHIEHCNKVLEAHRELVTMVVNETEAVLNTYLPILGTYINGIVALRTELGNEVRHILNSSKELRHAAGSVNELIQFMSAIEKLDKLLTPELVEKIRKLAS